MEKRIWALAALSAFVFTISSAQEGGLQAEFCGPGSRSCSEDRLEIVFESGTATHEGPIEPGVEIPIRVVLDARSEAIQGYSWAVKHDPEYLSLLPESVTTAGTILDPEHPDTAVSPRSFNATRAVPGGFFSAIVLALQEKREMPLGRHVICLAAYRVENAAPCTVIRFVHERLAAPGSPPVALNVTADGKSRQPRYLRHGLLGSGACPETCDDIADNDGDGLADCADPDCASAAVCGEEICADGIDNDADSEIDCLDRSCRFGPQCREDCTDGIDNDRNGLDDCEDPKCSSHASCKPPPPPPEECTDAGDNDGDSLIDCDDPDCRQADECIEPETCADGIDNDRDGGTDCADRDCAGDPACPRLEVCNDGIDNDEDGRVDCEDGNCRWEVPCTEICNDGIDNDGDGFVDGLDRACTGYGIAPQAGNPSFPLYIRGDADGNGRINIMDAVITIQVVLEGRAPPFECREALNANDDGGLSVTDALSLLRYIFFDGPAPPHPFPECGTHLTYGCHESSPECPSQEG